MATGVRRNRGWPGHTVEAQSTKGAETWPRYRAGGPQANSARARSEMAITAGLRSFLSTVIA